MLRKMLLYCLGLAICMSLALIGEASPQAPVKLRAAQVVAKNISAKGGTAGLAGSSNYFLLR